jgi:hypothetical protein
VGNNLSLVNCNVVILLDNTFAISENLIEFAEGLTSKEKSTISPFFVSYSNIINKKTRIFLFGF